MAIAITALIVLAYALWALRRRRGGVGAVRAEKLACKWDKTGQGKGRFEEYRCATCGVAALSHTGAAPQDCKKILKG